MTVCNFFLQGRCRYGDKCWNEHPEGGRGGDYRGNQQPSRGGGFGNRVWVNPSQRSGGSYIQPSTFSRDGSDWSKRDVKSSEFSFSSQNRFTALHPQNNNDKGGQTSADDNTNHVDTIQNDMEAWQSSGQWPFSCYSILSVQISGFVELSPEELRLEYYTSRASGDLQPYVNSVQQLSNQWKSRVQELQTMNNSTQISVISELNNSTPQTSFGSSSGFKSTSGFESTSASGFGSTSASGFGSTTASGFGSTTASGFGSTTASGFGSTTASGFGSTSASGFGTGGFGSSSQSSNTFSFASDTQQAPGFSSAPAAQPSSGFGTASQSAAAFSFAAPAADNKPSTGTSASAAGFSFKSSSSSSSAGGFGTGFSSSAAGSSVSGDGGDRLFTAHSDLTADELKEFRAKRFTLGQIPLKPPPADLLAV